MSSTTSLARAPRPLRPHGTRRAFAATGSLPQTSPVGRTAVRVRSRRARAGWTTLRRAVRRLSAIATATLVLTAAAVLAVVAIGPHVFGYRTSTMLGASMAPGIERGDLVVSVPVRAAEVAVGDVITYRSPVEAGRYETRRVVSVGRDAAGRVSLVTRADASDTVDPWVVTAEGGTVWRSTHVVRHLGEVVGVLSAPLQQTWALWGVLGLALLMGLRGIGTTGKERTDV